ncbi:hypothetical protein FS593_00945 [Lelliottia amnigena]|uniref:hypothetical protein n=1 Tax=Lelliottia amnigena TaxID=61646 RepID=UPI001F32D078|nr:hypothetical protein [Lelliottia amnigena]UJD92954.1 hypothetical protein FS593_00945 [Lelliottia amnigena]
MILRVMILFLMLFSAVSYAFEKCPDSSTECDNTALGKLEYIWGKGMEDKQSRILLNGREIFKNDSSQIGWDQEGWFYSDNQHMGDMSKFVVYYDLNEPRQITQDLYLYRAYRIFYFSGEGIVISNEFYPYKVWNIDIDWVSWGKKNAVIAFKDGSRFKYEKGQVTMIDDGTKTRDDN